MATYKKLLKNRAGDTIIPVTNISDYLYPVGSIYMSATMSTAEQVHSALGGTWTAWGAGRVPVGVDTSQTEFNTVEKTGGEKTHTLTISEIPKHQHRISCQKGTPGNSSWDYGQPSNSWNATAWNPNPTEPIGGNGAHNNLQPYITCYMYKRTA